MRALGRTSMSKTPMKSTVVFYHEELFGRLLTDEDYYELGGAPLADAFRKHHVQLAQAPSGEYRIIDDMNCCDVFYCIRNVDIEDFGDGRWKFSPYQDDPDV